MTQGPKQARAVAIALRRRRPQPTPDWMWLLLAVLLALGMMLANPVRAQTSVPPPGTAPASPGRVAPTLPPGAGGDVQAARPLPETSATPSVVPPPKGGDMPVITPPASSDMPVIAPPGTSGGEKGATPK